MPSLRIRRRAISLDTLCLMAHRPIPGCRCIPPLDRQTARDVLYAVDQESVLAVLILVIALLVILIGAELFTNGIEWVGES